MKNNGEHSDHSEHVVLEVFDDKTEESIKAAQAALERARAAHERHLHSALRTRIVLALVLAAAATAVAVAKFS